MKWIDYRERLGLGFSEEKKLDMCKNRLWNIIPKLQAFYSSEYLFAYANVIGESYQVLNYSNHSPILCAYRDIDKASTMKEFLSKYVAMVNTAWEKEFHKSCGKLLLDALLGTLEHFQIPYEVLEDKDGCFVFPKGVEEFDRELVSNVLIWLEDYPETEKAWIKALKAYTKAEDSSQTADLFRKALETFFQQFFNSSKALEKLKSEYGKYLKENGVPGELAGNFETLLQQYTNFINNYAKHHDKASDNTLEYIMYQTGNMIRLLITIARQNRI